tara:strand:- start:1169 stop:1366 length:198 start_codon:yes stop_codon:yes gene_type:complete
MLQICKRFISTNKKLIPGDMKTRKIVERFFKTNDKDSKIREALKFGEKEINEALKKSGINTNNKK